MSKFEVRAAARVLVAALAIAFAILFLIAPPQARANACDAGGEKLKTDSGIDPCAEYKLNKTAATRQYVSGGVHAAAAVLCGIQCVPSYAKTTKICDIGTYSAIGADAIGAMAIRNKGEELGGVLMGSLTTAFGASMMGKMFGGDEAAAGVEKTGAETGEKGGEKKFRKGACIKMGLEALQSGNQFYQASKSKGRAKDALDKKLELAAPDLPKLAAGGGDMGGGGSASAPTAADVRIDTGSGEPVVSAKDIKESAATAEFKPLFDAFKNETGKSAEGIFDAMANGVNPAVAAAALAGGALGSDGAAVLSKIGELGEEEAAKEDAGAALAGGVQGYERTGGGGGAKQGSDDDGMGDLSAMLAGLMPGKDGKEAAAQGAKGIQFGRAPSAVSPDGFHPPSRSIFEIVDSRYQAVAGRFLAGDVSGSPRQPASVVPKNVYLKH